jgi:hypothetical protein
MAEHLLHILRNSTMVGKVATRINSSIEAKVDMEGRVIDNLRHRVMVGMATSMMREAVVMGMEDMDRDSRVVGINSRGMEGIMMVEGMGDDRCQSSPIHLRFMCILWELATTTCVWVDVDSRLLMGHSGEATGSGLAFIPEVAGSVQ